MRNGGIAFLSRSRSRTSSCQAGGNVWTAAMSAEPSMHCLGRSDCVRLPPATGRACTTFGTALRFKRWCVGIARVRMSSGACPSFQPISVTPTSPIPTGISPAHRNCSERRGSEWRKGGEVFYEKPRRLACLVRVILHATPHRSTKGKPAHHRFLSGYLSFAVAFCSETIAPATVATPDGRPECAIPGDILERPRKPPRQWRTEPESPFDGDSIVLPLRSAGSASTLSSHPAGTGHPEQEAASTVGTLFNPTRDQSSLGSA